MERIAAIRARNLARYSPEARAQLAAARGRHSWQWRGWTMAALVAAAIAQASPLPVRIVGDLLAVAALGVSWRYFRIQSREIKKALAALRASRLAHEQRVGTDPNSH